MTCLYSPVTYSCTPFSRLVHIATNVEFDISIEGMLAHTEGTEQEKTSTGKRRLSRFMRTRTIRNRDMAQRNLKSGSSKQVTTGTFSQATATRESDTHYRYSFNFEYDLSTSSNPYLAGHASDIIVGGGLSILIADNTFQGKEDYCFTYYLSQHNTLTIYLIFFLKQYLISNIIYFLYHSIQRPI